MSWTLILFIYAGLLSKTDAVALASVTDIRTAQECSEAGQRATQMTSGSLNVAEYICIEVDGKKK